MPEQLLIDDAIELALLRLIPVDVIIHRPGHHPVEKTIGEFGATARQNQHD
jgi:hypothetical protein